jgi:twitching motility two-component system response regulator PilH
LARRILLADDSVTAQNMGRRILTDAGYEVVTVNNGSAALKKIAENKPDIIILDVYMPGYGGLEVCQRVKQSPDTARIPVLLTVGKLEPFKPEEARRVGADAFIIKPFEATELLTALTKLEDKIVAAPQPQKSGRFAKALAAVEQSTGERFGDKETGWKNRLTIPGPNAKPAPETEAPETASGPARDFDRSEAARPVEPRQEFERPIPAGLPPDITPEEIAAITAAAASFDGKAGHPTVIPEGTA